MCLTEKEGYKKPHGMSSANVGTAFNIIGITMHRNTDKEYCLIMINPKIIKYYNPLIKTNSNCGSLTLEKPIKVPRWYEIDVEYYDRDGKKHQENFTKENGAYTIQHEIDHNKGILITDY
jgi:peptide deformylase